MYGFEESLKQSEYQTNKKDQPPSDWPFLYFSISATGKWLSHNCLLSIWSQRGRPPVLYHLRLTLYNNLNTANATNQSVINDDFGANLKFINSTSNNALSSKYLHPKRKEMYNTAIQMAKNSNSLFILILTKDIKIIHITGLLRLLVLRR